MATCCSFASPTSQDSGSLFKLASDRGFLTYTGKFGGERHAVPHDNSIQFLIRKLEQDDSRGSHFLHIWIPFFLLPRRVPLGFQACGRYFWATPSRVLLKVATLSININIAKQFTKSNKTSKH